MITGALRVFQNIPGKHEWLRFLWKTKCYQLICMYQLRSRSAKFMWRKGSILFVCTFLVKGLLSLTHQSKDVYVTIMNMTWENVIRCAKLLDILMKNFVFKKPHERASTKVKRIIFFQQRLLLIILEKLDMLSSLDSSLILQICPFSSGYSWCNVKLQKTLLNPPCCANYHSSNTT